MNARTLARASALLGAAAGASLMVGCDVRAPFEAPEWSLERMIDEPRVRAYDPSAAFDDGSGMRRPPEGTVPTSRDGVSRVVFTGVEAGAFVTRIPVPLTPALLARGRDRFDLVCATCHGVTGTGESVVASKMQLRPPPSLHLPRTRAFPPGRVYGIISDGYGLMPSFGALLTPNDRWAVVAYLRALWLSRAADVAALPEETRRELEGAAR
jgi:mono/diheme cytochrome c family protein